MEHHTDTGTPTGTLAATGTPGAGHRNADGPERWPTGTPGDRNAGAGEVDDGWPERNDERSDDSEPVTHHVVVAVDAVDAVDAGDRNGEGSGEGSDDERPYLLFGGLRRLVEVLRFANEPLPSLRVLLRLAKKGAYSGSRIPVVRSANIAFFWLVTAPVLTVVLLGLWLFAVSLHRAFFVAGLVVLVAIPVDTIPVLGWLVPGWLVVGNWSATTWQWVCGGVVGFVGATVIVLLGQRRR